MFIRWYLHILGYMVIGVDYAFLFGVIAGLTNLIPYLGPYLGLAPAFLVTVFNDPVKALLCCGCANRPTVGWEYHLS